MSTMDDEPLHSGLRRAVKQRRSRERVEKILTVAADELTRLGSAEDLTTTGLSTRAGLPVASVYRYFADRWAIVEALIDREIERIDEEIIDELAATETVKMTTLLELFMEVHYRHFKDSPAAIVVWFGARGSDKVMSRVAGRYLEMARWIQDGSGAAGLAVGYPHWGGEALVWICDRTFEVMFREERSEEEERAIMREGIEMMSTRLMKYATPDGVNGIPAGEFLRLAGPFAPQHAVAIPT